MTLRCDEFNSIQQQLNSVEHSVYVDQLKQVNSSNNIIIIVFFASDTSINLSLLDADIYQAGKIIATLLLVSMRKRKLRQWNGRA